MEIKLEENMFEILQDLELNSELISSACIPRFIKDFYCKIKHMKNKKIFSKWLIRTENIIKNVQFMINVLVFLMQKYKVHAIFVRVISSYRMEDHFLDFMLVASRQQKHKTEMSIELRLPLKIALEIAKQIIGKFTQEFRNNIDNKNNIEEYMPNYNKQVDAFAKRFDRLKIDRLLSRKTTQPSEMNTQMFLNDLGSAEKSIQLDDVDVQMSENGTIRIISSNEVTVDDTKRDSYNNISTNIIYTDLVDDDMIGEEQEEENMPFGIISDKNTNE